MTTDSDYTFTVTLNGDTANALVDQYRNAAESLQVTIDEMRNAAPHSRNYISTDPDKYRNDRKQFEADVRSLHAIQRRMMNAAVRACDMT